MQYNEDYVLTVLRDGGLISRKQIDGARSRLNGEPGVLEVLIDDGALSEVDVSRTLAAQAQMDWIDISTMIIPPQVINEIRGEDARRFKVIPVAFGESGLVVAVGNPLAKPHFARSSRSLPLHQAAKMPPVDRFQQADKNAIPVLHARFPF